MQIGVVGAEVTWTISPLSPQLPPTGLLAPPPP
jgi:hypothetical protein